jgi:ribosomal protein L4
MAPEGHRRAAGDPRRSSQAAASPSRRASLVRGEGEQEEAARAGRPFRPRAGRHAPASRRSKFDNASEEAAEVLALGKRPDVLIVTEAEESLIKSFRNLDRVLVTIPAEVEVAEIVWARSLLVSETALPLVQARAEKEKTA